MNKIKVVWLCHFVNKEMKNYFNTTETMEMAPWIDNYIKLFKNKNNIQLYIVAPNLYTNKDCTFLFEGIYYYFYSFRNRYIPKKAYIISRIIFSRNYFFIKRKIGKIINQINPDIIHLHGAENPYYSIGILPLINKFPILLTIQGFIRNTSSKSLEIRQRIRIEEEIIRKCTNFGVRTKEMNETVLALNPKAKLFFHNNPIIIPEYMKGKESDFDIVFFARVCKDKGIEDLLTALIQVKIEIPNVSLTIIGPVNKYYKRKLNKIINSFGLQSNVVWAGFMGNQQEMFKHVIRAKMCVLPTFHDTIPGTIIESMFMKLPVISYSVGGIPELNSVEETVFLVEKNNITMLSNAIISLLHDEQRRFELADKAYNYAIKRFNNNRVVEDIMYAYSQIINKL